MAFLTALLGLGFGETANAIAFAVTGAVAAVLATALWFSFRGNSSSEIGILFASTALAWLVFGVVAALPFAISASLGAAPDEFSDWSNCVFEGVSSTTSSGLTVTRDTSALPKSIQFWRSFCQWTGGLGIVVAALTILDFGDRQAGLYRAAARSRTLDGGSEQETGRRIWWVYGILSLIVITALGVGGMPWWEALNHGMTSISTGGFTMNGKGMGAYPAEIQAIVMVAMLLGSLPFVLCSRAISRKSAMELWRDRHLRAFLLVAVAGALVCISVDGRTGALDSAFLWVSALTTSGFSTVAPSDSQPAVQILLIVAMFIGGMAGSTSGGIKFQRLLAILSLLGKLCKSLLHKANLADPEEWRHSPEVSSEEFDNLSKPLVILLLWTAVFVISGAFLATYAPATSGGSWAGTFEAVSALGCVGLSSGLTSAGLETAPKLLLCVVMWAGRIEILPVLILIRLVAGRSSK